MYLAERKIMYGSTGASTTGNLIVIRKGNLWHWMNQATGHVSNVGYNTYDEAEAAAAALRANPSE
jgi:hypothetical protein